MPTASDYFAKSVPTGYRARAVLPIGIAGSGKSTWIQSAQQQHWALINADELRVQYLRYLQTRGQSLVVRGVERPADPNNPGHVFCPELRERLPELIQGALERAMREGRNIVLDITNLRPSRARWIHTLRSQGYWVEALRFEPLDAHTHAQHVEMRVKQGGLDLAPKDSLDPASARLQIVQALLVDYNLYCRDLRVDPTRNHLSTSVEDVFNAIETVRVERFAEAECRN